MSHESAFNRRTKELEKEFHQEELAELKAELARLTALLEDRTGLINVIRKANWEFDDDSPKRMARSEYVADRLIAYLKPSLGS